MTNNHQAAGKFITKPLLLLTTGHFVTDLSQGALPILLPFLKELFALSYAQVGLIVLIQNVTSSVIQPLFGYITDKVTLPWLLPASILLAGSGLALTGHAPSYALLLTIVIITGLGVAGFHPQASRSANLVSPTAVRGRSMGLFSVGGNFGMASGSMAMTLLLLLPGGLHNTVWFLLPASLTALAFLQFRRHLTIHSDIKKEQAAHQSPTQSSVPKALLAILLLFIFIRSSIHTGLSTYIPLYYINYLNGDPLYASYLLTIFLLGGVAGTFCGASLSDRFGRKMIILVSMLVSFPLIALIPLTSGLITLLLVSVIGFALISSFATTVVLAQEMMPNRIGMAAGLTIGFSIGLGGLGATLLGAFADRFGIADVFTVLAVLPLAGALCVLKLPGKLFPFRQ